MHGARVLGRDDYPDALDVCDLDPLTNVFVAARLLEGGAYAMSSALGVDDAEGLRSLCWMSANVVPVNADDAALDAYADRLRRHQRRTSSLFGDATQVLGLWDRLERQWGPPRSLRRRQPMMAVSTAPLATGGEIDPRVRPARPEEVDLVVPASAHMFTEEIGYRPYIGSDRDYRRLVSALIGAGQTFVLVERGRVIFKADVGSVASGVAQIQGVWVAPDRRGQGIAIPAMNAVVQQVLDFFAHTVTLYVNDFNEPAVRTYTSVGFRQVGEFATVIL